MLSKHIFSLNNFLISILCEHMTARKDEQVKEEIMNGMVWEITTYYVPEKDWFCYEVIGTKKIGSGYRSRDEAHEAAIKSLE